MPAPLLTVAMLALTSTLAWSQGNIAVARSAPAPLDWNEVSDVAFDLDWRLPTKPGGSERDLVTRMKVMLDQRFSATDDVPWARSFGDAVRALRDLSPPERKRELATMRRAVPDAWAAYGHQLSDLLDDAILPTDDWDPTEPSTSDGFIEGPTYDVTKIKRAPWSDLDGATQLYQVATLMDADLVSIKAAENDYDAYLKRRHAGYEEVYAVRGSYRAGSKPDGTPFAAIKVYFRCDLPFPFSGYDGTLNVMSQLDTDGHLVTDFYCLGDDFYWMAGRDTCVPVYDSEGAWVTSVVVRQSGFDLTGVPDGSDERAASNRGILGNVKMLAERIDRTRRTPPLVAGSVPRLP